MVSIMVPLPLKSCKFLPQSPKLRRVDKCFGGKGLSLSQFQRKHAADRAKTKTRSQITMLCFDNKSLDHTTVKKT